MLPVELVAEVKRQLDEGQFSQRQIARALGVSRGTVSAIATGKRGLHGREFAPGQGARPPSPTRCPSCGARVYLPCVLCEARAYRQQHSAFSQLPGPKRVA